MRNTRHSRIDRSDIDDDESASPTLSDVDAALYGKLARVDGSRRITDRTRFGAFRITATGLDIGEGAQQKDWDDVGQFLFQVDSGIQWMLGDWLLYGETAQWGDTDQIAAAVGRDRNTLYGYVSVCRSIPMLRRRNTLTFGHHREVMTFKESDQDSMLDYAEQHGLSVADFRRYLRQTDQRPRLSAITFPADSMSRLKKISQRGVSRLTPDQRREVRADIQFMQRWLADLDAKLE